MNLHINWNAVGLWVGIVSFILAIPLSILGNVLTPKFQRWWAKTAANRAHLRLANIAKTLSRLDDYDAHPIDPVGMLVKGIANTVLGMACLGIGILMLYMLSFPDPTLEARNIYVGAAYFMVLIGIALCRWAFGTFSVDSDELTYSGRQKKRAALSVEVKQLFGRYPELESVDKLPALSLIRDFQPQGRRN